MQHKNQNKTPASFQDMILILNSHWLNPHFLLLWFLYIQFPI